MGAGTVTQLAADYPHLPRRIVLEDPPWRDFDGSRADRTATMQQLIVELSRENNPTWDDEELWLWSLGKTLISASVAQGTSALVEGWREATLECLSCASGHGQSGPGR